MKWLSKVRLTVEEARQLLRALISTKHPINAQIVAIRRCNLSCTYCNEYDQTSDPVPIPDLFARIDRLKELKTASITITGGEPLLHPQLSEVIERIRFHRMVAGVITNAYLLTKDRIRELNESGLQHMQISIDNAKPDEVSVKSLKVLDKKLKLLADYADFKVNINCVLGALHDRAEDALLISERAVQYGFSHSIGIIHQQDGFMKPLSEKACQVYRQIKERYPNNFWSYVVNNRFQDELVKNGQVDWKCRAGARYLYICEDGLVHYCSQQRGNPGIPLEEYTNWNIQQEYSRKKLCSKFCTIGCVQRVSQLDNWRDEQTLDPPYYPILNSAIPISK